MTLAPIRAVAIVDDESGISLSHLIAESKRDEYQAELDELTAKLAQKGATHSLRLVDVVIMPADEIEAQL